VRTWAPRGQTPVLQYHFNWKVLSATAGITWWNFYFRLYPTSIRAPQVVNFLGHLPASSAGQAAGGVGRTAGASGALGQRLPPRTARSAHNRVVAGLRPGTQSGGVHLGLLETTPASQLLSSRFRSTQPPRPPRAAADASAPAAGEVILASSKTVTIKCRTQ